MNKIKINEDTTHGMSYTAIQSPQDMIAFLDRVVSLHIKGLKQLVIITVCHFKALLIPSFPSLVHTFLLHLAISV